MREISSETPAELALVLHFHQPVGNFDHVFEKVTAQCYEPFLRMLGEFEGVRTHLHLNGILLEWFDRHRPELVSLVGELARSGRVELLTGGHQEPILTVLPEEDAIAQVQALSLELEERFGVRPRGAWLTERVYEPRLPTPLARAGVRWVTLDDLIFRWAGIDEGDLYGHYVTDDAGRALALFPAAKSLRYTIPFRPPAETFALLHELSVVDDTPPLMVYADDVEKFGEWPGTHEWVYEKGWLRDFFRRLQDDPLVRTVHLSERLARCPALGRVYPPTASYPEMTVWAMPTAARARMEHLVHALEEDDPRGILPDLRGGHWRGFLAKYPEVHRLHKRMLAASRRLSELRARNDAAPALDRAMRDLHRGQCNDAYWHGAFGGVYLPHLRRAVEHHLIRAVRAMDAFEHGTAVPARSALVDFHADGSLQIELTTAPARALVDPVGANVLAWDLLGAGENWLTVVQRHEEPFHADLREGRIIRVDEHGLPLEPEGAEDGVSTIHGAIRVKPGVGVEDLAVDRHSRVGGVWWSAAAGLTVDDPRRIEEQAEPLARRWDLAPVDGESACSLRTEQGGLAIEGSLALDPADGSLVLDCEVRPLAGPRTLWSEWNLLVGWTGDDLECAQDDAYEASPAGEHRFRAAPLDFRGGGGRVLRIEAGGGTDLRWAPVHTVSSSEAGLERIGQGTCFLFSWAVEGPTRLWLRLAGSAPHVADEDPGS